MNAFKYKCYITSKALLSCLIFSLMIGLSINTGHAALAQSPLFLTASVDPNILFNMSIETPMGGAAYNDQPDGASCAGRVNDGGTVGVCYFKTQTYLGYFDPNKCYVYSSARFEPSSDTINSDHECSGKYSGNFMNWATMTAMDMFVWTMTGGNRIVDSADNTTVIKRMRKTNNDSWFPYKLITAARNVAPSTVTPWSDTKIFIYNSDFTVNFGTSRGGTDRGNALNVNLRVCDKTKTLESNCIAYGGGTYYKPEGLIQKNADHMRFGVTSYSNTTGNDINGGVLRSNIKYVGTLKPDASGGTIDNANKEIKADGTIVLNPNPADATASSVTQSGVIPYLNRFSDTSYKSNDPASELFYESVRYFKHLGPTPEYLTGAKGGFPILSAARWEDPIQESCQKNYIIGINDANPWMDKKLPGTAFTSSTFGSPSVAIPNNDYGQPSNPDTAINVKNLTNTVGDLEGLTGTSQCVGCTATNCNMAVGNKTIPGLGEVMGTCPSPGKYNSYYIAGLAYYANTQDIRTDIDDKQTVNTFMVDTQEYNATPLVGRMNMLWLAGKYGGFNDANDNAKPDNKVVDGSGDVITPSEWDTDDNGEPDNYVLATKPDKLVTALNKAFGNIISQISSASAVAANATRLDAGTLIYQAKFNSTDWSGQLLAFSVDTGETIANWEAAKQLPDHANRKIYTYDPTAEAGLRGIPFLWDDLTPLPHGTSQQDFLNQVGGVVDGLGKFRVNWLRGDNSHEARLGGSLRNRIRLFDNNVITNSADLANPGIKTNHLGDIINSDPVFVGTDSYGYDNLPDAEGDSYSDFRETAEYKTRRPMIYVGANDGMLHGFDARKNAGTVTTGGTEVLAYIPNALFPELSKLTSPNYTHQYYVDGLIGVGDGYIDGAWRTMLAGTTGAGGRAVFALDVTDPDNFGPDSVLWEFTEKNDNDLGYTLAQPVIARVDNDDGDPNHKWAVIVGNGYESDNGHAVLFILDAKTGSIIKKIDTGVGSVLKKNGLSSPLVVDFDADQIADAIYAGDLYGDLWKFDVSKPTVADWDISGGGPIFVACEASGGCVDVNDPNRQPITGKPNVGTVDAIQKDGVMLYFGTGKYIENNDNVVGPTPQVQTFYGLWDKNSAIPGDNIISDKADLQAQTIWFEGILSTVDGTPASNNIRLTTKNPVCYSISSSDCSSASPLKKGWFLNLVPPSNIAAGERVVTMPLLRLGSIIFSTLTPDSDPCKSGGTGILMVLNATSGQASGKSTFGVNDDNKVDSNDQVMKDGVAYTVSGADLGIGIFKPPAIVDFPPNRACAYTSGTAGADPDCLPVPGEDRFRHSWQQLR